jgi:hypothetical protein
VIFKRTPSKEVESVSISVQGNDLVGTKEAAASTSGNKEEEFHAQIWAEKVEN